MRKKINLDAKIYPSKDEFTFGCCASIAICSAFGFSYDAFKVVSSVMKIKNIREGLTFFQCKKLINLLASTLSKDVKYTPNVTGVTYAQMIFLLNEDKYIVMFNEHLSYVENGTVYDSYCETESLTKWVPTGWWRIK